MQVQKFSPVLQAQCERFHVIRTALGSCGCVGQMTPVRLSVVLAVATLAAGFENARMRSRTKKMKEISSFVKVPGFGGEETLCAACEAVAQSLEAQMKTDQHKESPVVRTAKLMETCDYIDNYFPATLKPISQGGPEVLHFVKAKPKDLKEGEARVGLSEYCTALVEEYEEELSAVMDAAQPISSETTKAMSEAMGVYDGPRYELKVDTCVTATKQCSHDALNRISSHRIGMMEHMDPSGKGQMKRVLNQLKGLKGMGNVNPGAEIDYKDVSADLLRSMDAAELGMTEEEKATKIKEVDKAAAKAAKAVKKATKGAAKGKDKKKPTAEAQQFWSLPANPSELMAWAQKSPILAASAGLATLAVVYIGGLVARVW